MREILFKAKRIDNGEWVEGFVFDDGFVDSKRMFVGGLVITDYKGAADDRWNIGTNFYEVRPDTICQYTGLTDKNGNKIWENDVVICYDENHKVSWDEDDARFILEDEVFIESFNNIDGKWCEVIGNIFENADLPKGE